MGRRLREGVCVCQRKGVSVWLLWGIRKGCVCVCVCRNEWSCTAIRHLLSFIF